MATYHVDNQAVGADDNNVGSVNAPFKTLSKANNVVISGDTVLVNAGTYREQVSCKVANATWRAAQPKVYIRGTLTVPDGVWSSTGTNAWSISYTTTSPVQVVLVDDTPCSEALSATTTTNYQFFHDSAANLLYVDIGGPSPQGHVVEAGNLSTGFSLNNLTGCTIEGFRIYGQNSYGILVQGGGGHAFRYNEVLGAASGGIRLQPLSPQLFQPTDNGVGGSLGAGTYGYIVTAVISGQESLPSFELALTISANHAIQLQWSKIATATSFNIYGRTKLGETLLANVPNSFGSGFPTWVDNGSLTPDGVTLPPLNSNVTLTPCFIENNEIWRNLSHGIYMYGANDCYIRGNHCHHNVFHGIALLNNANNNMVEFNVCHNNFKGNRTANGIQVDNFGAGTNGSSNNIIQYNRCYRNEDSGISIYNGSANCIVNRNVCYLNGDHGVDCSNATNCHMVNNMSLDNVTAGFNAEGNSQGIRMYNNIAMDNGVQSPRTSSNYRIDGIANQNAQLDYNLSFLTVPAANQVSGSNSEITWGTTNYDTLAAFKLAIPSQMAHGTAADPQFVNAACGDFHLKTTSPARGMGTVSTPDFSSTDFFGNSTASPPNAGPIE